MFLSKILTDTFKKGNIPFLAIVLCMFMQMLTVGEAYRVFAYVNILVVLSGFFFLFRSGNSLEEYRWIKYLIFFILGISIIHFLAVQKIELIKEIRHLLVAAFLVIGVYMLDEMKGSYVRKYIFNYILATVFLYTIIQVIALGVFDRPFGTTKNPHYLALYSSVSFILAIYTFTRVSTWAQKTAVSLCTIILGAILIYSASRPTWLGLLVAALFVSLFLTRQQRFYGYTIITVILGALTITDAGNFATRTTDLLDNLRTEERVAIWQDTWEIQASSQPLQWLVGHGIDSFEDTFNEAFPVYRERGEDFNSPHNYVLELLYISGVFGLSLMIGFFWWLYSDLVNAVRRRDEDFSIYITMLAILTSSLVLAGLTLPFFSSYSMNIIAITVGMMLYLRKRRVLENG